MDALSSLFCQQPKAHSPLCEEVHDMILEHMELGGDGCVREVGAVEDKKLINIRLCGGKTDACCTLMFYPVSRLVSIREICACVYQLKPYEAA